MNDGLDDILLDVRPDVSRFTQDIAAMRAQMEGPLVSSAERAGHAIEAGLLRAVRTGKLGFEDLGKVALSIMAQIASAAVQDGLSALGIGSGKSGSGSGSGGGILGGLLQLGTSLLMSALGLPGRATGGPVSPGRAYLVGERGPEVFLPTSSGQIMPGIGGQGGGRDVRVSIMVNSNGSDTPQALARSARQVARAVRGALGD